MTNFILTQDWNYSWDTLENMLPYERNIVIDLIMGRIEKQRTETQQ